LTFHRFLWVVSRVVSVVQTVQQIDALDGSIDGAIKIPADQITFLTEGFFLNRIVKNKHTPLIFYRTDVFLQHFPETFRDVSLLGRKRSLGHG